MFTGIVQERGRAELDGSRLSVRTGIRAKIGDSVAIDGVCLTVVDGDRKTLAFDAVPETLARTTLGGLEPGNPDGLKVASIGRVFCTGPGAIWVIAPDGTRIGVAGSSFGAAVAVYSGGVDKRVAVVISSGGWGDGETKFRKQHESPEAWKRFTEMMERGKAAKA